jgi:hypothetical protein
VCQKNQMFFSFEMGLGRDRLRNLGGGRGGYWRWRGDLVGPGILPPGIVLHATPRSY